MQTENGALLSAAINETIIVVTNRHDREQLDEHRQRVEDEAAHAVAP